LKALGLNSYESKVFLTLCERGAMDGKTLSKISGVPLGRIYDVLRDLEHKGAIYVQNSRPKIYAVPDVERAIENIMRSKVEEIQKEIGEMKVLAEELKKELRPRRKEESIRTFWSLAMGIERGIDLITQKLEGVQKSLLNVISPSEVQIFHSGRKKFARVVANLSEREVEIKLLATLEIAEKFNHPIPEMRVVDELPLPFTVLDDREVLIKVENPAKRDELLGALYMNDRKLVESLREFFMELWENGKEI